MRRAIVTALSVLVLGTRGAATVPAAEGPMPVRRAHLLLVIDLSSPEARVLHASVVERALPRHAGPARGWELRVEDVQGRVLHRARIPAAGMLRGERVASGKAEAITAPDPRAAIAVRVPILADAAAIRILSPVAGPPPAATPGSPGSGLEEGAAPEVEVARVEYPRVAP